MKLVLNFSMFLLAFFSFSNESFSLTDYQIKKICKKGVFYGKYEFSERPLTWYKTWKNHEETLRLLIIFGNASNINF